MAKTLAGTQVLLTIREFILENNLINGKNAEKPSVTTQVLFNTREFILERNLTNVKNVEKPLSSTHILLNIREFILEEKPYECKESGNGFNQSSHHIRHQTACTGEKP